MPQIFFVVSLALAHAAPKTSCLPRELAAQDCHLKLKTYDLRLLKTTLAWNDGTWSSIDPLPLAGEGVEWQKVEFGILAGRPIVQLWFWDKGVGELKVQSLHWYVADAEKRTLTLRAEGVVRRRTPRKGKTPLYDPMVPHALKAQKDGLLWRLGDKTKTI